MNIHLSRYLADTGGIGAVDSVSTSALAWLGVVIALATMGATLSLSLSGVVASLAAAGGL